MSCFLVLMMAVPCLAQEESNFRSKLIPWDDSVRNLDTMVVVPSSIIIIGNDTLPESSWSLNDTGGLQVELPPLKDSLTVTYRVLPFKYEERYANKDTLLIRSDFEREDPFKYRPGKNDRSALIDLGGFDKRGSIARGIQVGNNQDLSVNSDLNLQLSGKVTDEISLLANISDDNIPIQADGSTQQLQEFDQVFIKLYSDRASLIAGDHMLKSTGGHYSQYLKKARGAQLEWNSGGDTLMSNRTGIHAGAAVSRGIFSRNVFQGIEGNQGPYRLRGANNEAFIIVLSGTERVYIDGRLLKRGKEYDYTVDYNTAEITFTANRRITKDSRIVAEFQYAERSYSRSLINGGLSRESGRWSSQFDIYSEQDGRNQSFQQELDEEDRTLLSQIGDDLGSAFVTPYDTVSYSDDRNLYALRDSLGYDSIFVLSTEPDLAIYQVSFTQVGLGAGDYLQDGFSPNGRIYRWVAPDTVSGQIIRRGDHVPGLLLVTPKRRQMFSAGTRYQASERTWLSMNAALSNEDLNTFSSADNQDDYGGAILLEGAHLFRLRLDSSGLDLTVKGLIELRQKEFIPIERIRAVEFERNWNLTEEELDADQALTSMSMGLKWKKGNRLQYSLDRFSTKNEYRGLTHDVLARWKERGWKLDFRGSALDTDGNTRSTFIRHQAHIIRDLGRFRIGFQDIREDNKQLQSSGDTLSAGSYRFYEWQTYLSSSDSSDLYYKLFYKQRGDWRPEEVRLLNTAQAQEYGLEIRTHPSKDHSVKLVTSWRSLEIVRSELIASEPEDNFLGRLEYRGNFLKKGIRTNTFYEVGSGLERRREFVYLEVPTGQGTYVWVDYNSNGIRELDEFEIAQFQYEADFIRIFTPTNSFEKTFFNQVSQSINIEPGKWWSEKDGLWGFLARFSDQGVWRSQRKTKSDTETQIYDPFAFDVADSSLLSLNNSLRNSIFFNRADPIWSLDHSYSDNENKQLLTNGFESRTNVENKINARYTYDRRYTARLAIRSGRRSRVASYSSNRDYRIGEEGIEASIEWQPDSKMRWTLTTELDEKKNAGDVGETAQIWKIGIETRLSQLDKGSLNIEFDYLNIGYTGTANTSLAFEMLDGLKPGDNFTWSVFMQRSLAKNLEMNLTYTGRRSESSKTIHAGGVQLRAAF